MLVNVLTFIGGDDKIKKLQYGLYVTLIFNILAVITTRGTAG